MKVEQNLRGEKRKETQRKWAAETKKGASAPDRRDGVMEGR